MREGSPESPEARRKRLAKARLHLGAFREKIAPGTRPFHVMKRVVVGVYSDGFIHAGNLAYLSLLSIFPFVIIAAAVARIFGQTTEGLAAVEALLQTMPPRVSNVLETPIADVIEARSGTLLWLGALVGLWTTGSFIETIRDIIRRAYGVSYSRPFWEYRLASAGLIVGSVLLAMIAFTVSIVLTGLQQFLVNLVPGADDLVSLLTLLRVLPALVLFGALYLVFFALTPKRYRKGCPKWPGAAFVAIWWVATTGLLPVVLSSLGGYDLTYGSLAGVMIALIFFFIIGLGLVIGAELNAALAEPPEPTHDEEVAAVYEEAAEQAEEKADREAEQEEE